MIQTNRLKIREIADSKRAKNLGTYECGDLNIHLNSYYVQMRGSLDNLAWFLHYELTLLGEKNEDDPQTRSKCYLFGNEFLAKLEKLMPALWKLLTAKCGWAKDFKELRDPVAHRVPLYAVPGVADEAGAARFQELDRDMIEVARSGNLDEHMGKMCDAAQVGQYYPVFLFSGSSSFEFRSIPMQINIDQGNFLDVGEAVLDSMFRTATPS